ncbi:MAG: ABC transporter substrate-binding protein [Actinomycetota bacterium]
MRTLLVKTSIAVSGACLVAASCGGSNDSNGDAAPATTVAPATSASAPPTTDDVATTPASSAPDTTAAATSAPPITTTADATTRTVDHAFGTTDVPTEPQAIYVHDPNALDMLVALEAPVIGATRFRDEVPMPSYLEERFEGEIELSLNREINFEAVAALGPDLIVMPATSDDRTYDLFSQIAPTVVYGNPGVGFAGRASWNEALEEIADYVNRSDKVDEVLAVYDADVARLQDTIATESLEGSTIAVLRPRGLDLVWLQVPVGMTAGDTIWDDIGLPYQEVTEGLSDDGTFAEVSAERTDLITAEFAFMLIPDGLTEIVEQELDTNPLWSTIPAIANGNLCLINAEGSEQAWLATGPIGLERIADEIDDCLRG